MREIIDELYRRASGAYSDFEIALDVFRAFCVNAKTTSDKLQLYAEDLYLAAACTQSIPGALRTFERRFDGLLRFQSRRALGLGVNNDDFLQRLRMKLFVATNEPPVIASYAGHGALAGWLRVVAARTIIELTSHEKFGLAKNDPSAEDWTEKVADETSTELATIRDELRGPFQRALTHAVRQLSSTDRALLRQFYLHRVGVDGIAKLLGVHRSNASRAVARARGSLLRHTKEYLRLELGSGTTSVDSIFAVMRSDIAVNLGSLLSSIQNLPEADAASPGPPTDE